MIAKKSFDCVTYTLKNEFFVEFPQIKELLLAYYNHNTLYKNDE